MTNDASAAVSTIRLEQAAARILTAALPVPVRERWQPLRAGLMNVFLFEDERFPFADGRLLLRGTNGTGKSRVLAMTLPLLLDGSFKATRVEPDRDHNRQVAWNILMDEQDSATGYTWLEFGRLAGNPSGSNGDAAATEQFLTIGCGMRAKRGQTIKPWFFITTRRVDDSLALKVDGIPLTKRQLEDELGSSGQVYDSSQRGDYRRAVDEHLFRLGERYDALIELLLQLRQPKLAEKLDIVGLEETLREALPPLQESLLNDAADAFRELDQYRTSLENDRTALQHIQKFLGPYRDHIRRGVKRSLKQLTSTNSEYEKAQRRLRELNEVRKQATIQLEQYRSEHRQAKIDIKTGQAAISELQRSPEIQNAQRIDDLMEEANKLNQQVNEHAKDVTTAESDFAEAKQQQTSATEETDRQQTLVAEQSELCRQTAAPEALQNQHQEQIATCLTAEHADQFPSRVRKLQGRVETYKKSAGHLAARNQELQAIDTKLGEIRNRVQRLEHAQQDKLEGLATAATHYESTRETHWADITAWYRRAALVQVHLPSLETWAEQFDAWTADTAATDPSPTVLDRAKSSSITELIVQQEALRHTIGQHQSAIELRREEHERLKSGEAIEPPVRAHRSDLPPHADQQGKPFWKLVDFHPDIPESERGNWEAALHDAGLLDAVVTTDGRLLGVDDSTSAVQLISGAMPPQEASRQLARVLRPAVSEADGALGDDDGIRPPRRLADSLAESVNQILAVIGVGQGAGSAWVAANGQWQNGPLQGKLTKTHAQYIGDAARAQWRSRRLAELADEIARLTSTIEELEDQVGRIESTKSQIERLVQSFPSNQLLLDARSAQNSAQKAADETSNLLTQERDEEEDQNNKYNRLKRTRDDEAADVGLSAWADRADELQQRLQDYQSRLQTLDARMDAFETALNRQRAADRNVQRTQRHVESCFARLDVAKATHGQAEEKLRVLREGIGRDVQQMLTRLEQERQAQEQREEIAESLSKQVTEATSKLAVTVNDIKQRESESAVSDQKRREATDDFALLDQLGLLSLIDRESEIPAQPWAMTTAIRFARQLDTFLQNVATDEQTWLASQTRLHQAQTQLQQTIFLQEGLTIEVEPLRDGLQMVRFVWQGEHLAPTTAAARIESEIATREQILDQREQDTLEKYLLGEVAEGLRHGIAMAADLVKQMTTEVSRRPMKTGKQMRFLWRQDEDGPAGLKEACEVLSVDSATWSPEEREQIKLFLGRAIRQQRDEDETGSWHEHMRAALDYRRWHRIVIEQRKGPAANWVRLTRKTYAGGSGGEKAIALTLPPIAAAAAYYQTADPSAPRLILLDEAFAGISSDNRESCMALIVDFGLDAVLTSENEWGMYAGVPQLAICQLDRFADLNAVINRVFIWNGKDKLAATPPSEPADASLFSEQG